MGILCVVWPEAFQWGGLLFAPCAWHVQPTCMYMYGHVVHNNPPVISGSSISADLYLHLWPKLLTTALQSPEEFPQSYLLLVGTGLGIVVEFLF